MVERVQRAMALGLKYRANGSVHVYGPWATTVATACQATITAGALESTEFAGVSLGPITAVRRA
jgi:hypothetical protein